MRLDSPLFNGYEAGPDFDRARSMIATPFQYTDVDLSTAGVNVVLPIAGDFIYLDPAYNGVVTIELNNQYNDAAAPFQANAGWALQAVFKQVKLSWAAQAGKKVRLMYSTGERVVPAFSAQLNVTNQSQVRKQFSQAVSTIGTIAAWVASANASRDYLLIQNQSNTANIFVSITGGVANTGHLKIGPGGSFELSNTVPISAISIISDAAGTPYYFCEA
jgi:hypothetical protein